MRPADLRRTATWAWSLALVGSMVAWSCAAVFVDGWVQHGLAMLLVVVAGLFARAAGLGWNDLGLATDRLGSGLRWGLAAAALTLMLVIVAALAPQAGSWLADDRFTGLSGSEVAFDALVRIPIGTAAFEEFLFRGVLLGLLCRYLPATRALLVSSVVFGLWHVAPALGLADANDAASDLGGSTAGVVLGTVAVTTVGGLVFGWLRLRSESLVAPFLAHTALNSGSLLAAWAVG